MHPTAVAEQRIMTPVLGKLNKVAEQARDALVKAHTSGKPVAGLDRLAARLQSAMRAAASEAARRTPGLAASDLAPSLAWRMDRLKATLKAIKATERPSLALLLGLTAQVTGLGSALGGKVSDHLVTEHTATMDKQASAGRNEVLIFQPERDACVRCLAYAGKFRDPGGTFPAGLSFDPDAKPAPKSERIAGPPIHPHCRCSLEVIPAESARDNATALQREAERSILKGWALENESNAVRTRAARDLLDSGIVAPKSVLTETRKRLKAGGTFIRDVP